MKEILNPFKPAPNQNAKFAKLMKQQADFVDREILTQQFMIAYSRDVRNLEVFVSPEIQRDLHYSDEPDALWEFCSALAEAVAFGVVPEGKKRKKYLGLKGNGIFTSLSYMTDTKIPAFTVLEIMEWVVKIDFRSI